MKSKKYLVLLITLSLALLLFIGCGANDSDTTGESDFIEEDIDDVMISEEEANDLMNEINAGLEIKLPHEEGYPNYPDTFGGSYYNGQLCVLLTEDSLENRSTYRSLVSIPGGLSFREVDNSYNDLYDLMMRSSGLDQAADTTSIAVNDRTNLVDIGISADMYEAVSESISKKLSSNDISMINFIKEAPADTSASDVYNPFPDVELTKEEIDYIWSIENLSLEEQYGTGKGIVYTCFDESKGPTARLYFNFLIGKRYNLHSWGADPSVWMGDFEIADNKVILRLNQDTIDPEADGTIESDQDIKITFDIVDNNKLAFNAKESYDAAAHDLVLVGPGAKAPDIDGLLFEPDVKASLELWIDRFNPDKDTEEDEEYNSETEYMSRQELPDNLEPWLKAEEADAVAVSDPNTDITDRIPVYYEDELLFNTNGSFDLGTDACIYDGFSYVPNASGKLLAYYPTDAIRDRGDGTYYAIYDTDTGYRLFLFFKNVNGQLYLQGYPIVLSELLDMVGLGQEDISVGDSIEWVASKDPMTNLYIKMYRDVFDIDYKSAKAKKEHGLPLCSIHYLEDGLLKFEYEMMENGELKVSNIIYSEDRKLDDAIGNEVDYNILDIDLPALY